MKRLFVFAVSVILALLPVVTACAGQIDMHEIDAQVDQFFQKGRATGGALVVMRHGEIVYQRYYGYSTKRSKTPVTADTYFRSASVTKMISAIGIMQLYEQGKVNLDQDISTYFGYEIANPHHPGIPITLRQIMSHTTSISQAGGFSSAKNTIYNMLSKDARRPANFTDNAPGSKYSYSNFGAGLMGSIMEAAAQVSVNRYMRENVFAPLDIDAAYNACCLEHPEHVASIYKNGSLFRSAAKFISDPYDDFPDPESHYRITVGELFIRAADLAKLGAVLCGDGSYNGVRLLNPESVNLMRMNQAELNASVTAHSPYGLSVSRINNLAEGKTVYGHHGLYNGSMTLLAFDPETEFVFVMLSNGCSQVRKGRIGVLPRNLFEYVYPLFTKK